MVTLTLLVSSDVISITSMRRVKGVRRVIYYLLFKFIDDDLHKYSKSINNILSIMFFFYNCKLKDVFIPCALIDR